MDKQYENIIIGIDPGTNVMGYALLGVNGKKPELIVMGVLQLNRMEDHYMRLRHIYERVSGVIAEYLPDEMAIPITEYEPRKIKMAITGNGAASKEQVAMMLQRTLGIDEGQMPALLDATDALAAALCHFYERSKPFTTRGAKSWKSFIAQHPDRVKKG